MKSFNMELFKTDLIVLDRHNKPLLWNDGTIALWNESAVTYESKYDGVSGYEMMVLDVSEGEKTIPSTELSEPFKTQLIEELREYEP